MARNKKDEEQQEEGAEELLLVGEIPAVRLKAPKGATGISVDGEEYAVEDGFIVVPATAEAALRDHGYTDAE